MEKLVEEWAAHHRSLGHNPHSAPTPENPECWECDCPDTAWVAIWRIRTADQIRQKFAYLRNRPLPSYIADMRKRTEEQRGRQR